MTIVTESRKTDLAEFSPLLRESDISSPDFGEFASNGPCFRPPAPSASKVTLIRRRAGFAAAPALSLWHDGRADDRPRENDHHDSVFRYLRVH
jgi:hypothetical protein